MNRSKIKFGRAELAICFLGPLLALALFAAAIDYTAEGKLWWSHVQFLADDKLKGRDLASDGYQQAGTYVTGHFQQLGLKPGGDNGYLQSVKRFEGRLPVLSLLLAVGVVLVAGGVNRRRARWPGRSAD